MTTVHNVQVYKAIVPFWQQPLAVRVHWCVQLCEQVCAAQRLLSRLWQFWHTVDKSTTRVKKYEAIISNDRPATALGRIVKHMLY
jgi:hypothetical protein